MNSEVGEPAGAPGRVPDAGQPIVALLDLEQATSPDFMTRVRRRIFRRTAVSQVASYSWNLPGVILLEMASVLGHLIKVFGTAKEPER